MNSQGVVRRTFRAHRYALPQHRQLRAESRPAKKGRPCLRSEVGIPFSGHERGTPTIKHPYAPLMKGPGRPSKGALIICGGGCLFVAFGRIRGTPND